MQYLLLTDPPGSVDKHNKEKTQDMIEAEVEKLPNWEWVGEWVIQKRGTPQFSSSIPSFLPSLLLSLICMSYALLPRRVH